MLLIVVAVAVIPPRTMAAAIDDLSAEVHEQMQAVQGSSQTEPEGSTRCDSRVPHCPGGALSDATRGPLLAAFADSRMPLVERGAPAFVPRPLDRPPPALLR